MSAPTQADIDSRAEVESRFTTAPVVSPEGLAVIEAVDSSLSAVAVSALEAITACRELNDFYASLEQAKFYAAQAVAKAGVSTLDWTEVPA